MAEFFEESLSTIGVNLIISGFVAITVTFFNLKNLNFFGIFGFMFND